MSEAIELIKRAGRVTTTEDALAIIAEWERHVVETGKSPEEARAIVESNLGYLRQYLTEAEADRFFALASGEEYTPRIDEVSQLKARVAELEAALRDHMAIVDNVKLETGSSTPLADFVWLVGLMRNLDTFGDMLDALSMDSDEWGFINALFRPGSDE